MMAASSAAEMSQEALLSFLAERGGRAPNADLLDHFRAFLNSPEPQRRARAREGFKELVNAVATVRQEPGTGAKYVQLRKKYRGAGAPLRAPKEEATAGAAGAGGEEETPRLAPPEPQGGHGRSSNRRSGDGWRDEEDTREAKGVAREDGWGAAKAGGPAAPPAAPLGLEPPPEVTEVLDVLQPSPEGGDGGQAEEEEDRAGPPCTVVFLAPPRGDEAAEEEEAPLPTAATLGDVLVTTTTGHHTPRCGRKNFRERRLGSSPQMKRGGGGGGGGDSDSASLASSSAEDESGSAGGGGGSVALDPLEHAWMLCASDGRWESLESLLSCEPALLSKRDFVTGFSCLHWAAKHGRHELLARLVGFAHRHRLPVNVNARTSGGYTALHLAAMHGHLEVVKLLVGAYDADVELRDYSGRKASHYLSRSTAEEVRHLVGALQDEADSGAPNGGSRWRLSRVLPAHLLAYKLSHLSHHHHHHHPNSSAEEGEAAGEGAPKELSRKTSGSGRVKPRLNKIRFRTQIIHTTPSFRAEVEGEGHEERPLNKGSFKLRPKSNVFG